MKINLNTQSIKDMLPEVFLCSIELNSPARESQDRCRQLIKKGDWIGAYNQLDDTISAIDAEQRYDYPRDEGHIYSENLAYTEARY